MPERFSEGVCPVCQGPTKLWEDVDEYNGKTEITKSLEYCYEGHYSRNMRYGDVTVKIDEHTFYQDEYEVDVETTKEIYDRISKESMKLLESEKKLHAYEQQFILALRDDRFDQMTRLVYADWLDEQNREDESNIQRNWTPEYQRGKDHIQFCAHMCQKTEQELLDAARKYLAIADDNYHTTTLHLNFDTPDVMYDREAFWSAYEAVTGEAVIEEKRERFVSCGC